MTDVTKINPNTLKSEVREAIINGKANSCPMAIRLAWHASGTFDKNDGSGGSNGAGMRFEPESTDDANAGLGIMRDILKPVKDRHPELSYADLWTFAGAAAVEFTGGPQVPHSFGRTDFSDNSKCPANGRLPDAAQGVQHLRDVFYRQGFNDQEIVALSGAHTLGRCHISRSGFDGPWTRHPLKFDNQYFKNLVGLEWKPRKWDGPLQYEDAETGELMMLPTDMALLEDPEFKKWVEIYAKDEQKFFDDFAAVFAKLMANGAPKAECPVLSEKDKASYEFREAAMHGSQEFVEKHSKSADVHAVESSSGRSALHKAAFWGHDLTIKFLVNTCKLDVNAQDYNGDTALHDAARFGHIEVVKQLLAGKTDTTIRNKAGKTALDLANEMDKADVAALIKGAKL